MSDKQSTRVPDVLIVNVGYKIPAVVVSTRFVLTAAFGAFLGITKLENCPDSPTISSHPELDFLTTMSKRPGGVVCHLYFNGVQQIHSVLATPVRESNYGVRNFD